MFNKKFSRFFCSGEKLFFLLVVMNALPIFLTSHFPSVDGPAHLAITQMWLTLGQGGPTPFDQIYEIQLGNFPNWFCYLVLLVLFKLFPALVAEKIFVSAYVIALPLAARFALNGFSSKAATAAYLVIPLAFHFSLFFGFYNFSWGAVIVLLCIGYYLRARSTWHLHNVLVIMIAGISAYYVHATALIMATFMIALTETGFLMSQPAMPWSQRFRGFVRNAVILVGVFFPALVMLAIYAQSGGQGGPAVETFSGHSGILQRLTAVFSGYIFWITPMSRPLLGIGIVFVAVVILLAWRKGKEQGSTWFTPLHVVFLGLFALYLLAPFQVGVRWVPERLLTYVFIGAALMIGGCLTTADKTAYQRMATWLRLGGLILVIGGTVFRLLDLQAVAKFQDEYIEALNVLEPGQNVLTLRIDRGGNDAAQVASRLLIQGSGYATVLRDAVDVKLFQANTPVVPVKFRAERNPFKGWITDRDTTAPVPTVDLDSFERLYGETLEYVIVTGNLGNVSAGEAAHLRQRLDKSYELVFVSETGFVGVYRASDSQMDERR